MVGFCPGCGQEILNDSPKGHCPHCGYILTRPVSQHFTSPKYLFYQLDLHRERLAPTRRRGTKAPTREDLRVLDEVEKDYKRWLIEMHSDDRKNALMDAYHALRYLVASKTFGEDLKRVVDLGKRIGDLAQTIESYVKNGGGLLHEREIGPIPPDSGNASGSTATAR
jgi:hypothetical protein